MEKGKHHKAGLGTQIQAGKNSLKMKVNVKRQGSHRDPSLMALRCPASPSIALDVSCYTEYTLDWLYFEAAQPVNFSVVDAGANAGYSASKGEAQPRRNIARPSSDRNRCAHDVGSLKDLAVARILLFLPLPDAAHFPGFNMRNPSFASKSHKVYPRVRTPGRIPSVDSGAQNLPSPEVDLDA